MADASHAVPNDATQRSRGNWSAILAFTITAIVLGALWARHARDSGMLRDPQSAGIAASVAQLSVLLAAMLAMLIFSRQSFRAIGWRTGSFPAYVSVFVTVLAVVGLFTAVALATGWLGIAPGSANLTRLLSTFPLFLIIFCLFAFAEEFGWRGFLLPQLLSLGEKRALLVSGFIWFLWEAPLVYFGLLDPTIIKANLAAALLCHFLQVLAVAIALGYLRLRFGSVFLPTFAHGLLNSLGGLSYMFLLQKNPLWGDFGGPLGTILLVIVAGIIWRQLGKTSPQARGRRRPWP